MNTRFDLIRDKFISTVETTYQEGYITNPEYHVLRGAIQDSIDDLEESAREEIDSGEKHPSYLRTAIPTSEDL